MPVLEITNLSKHYGSTAAVDGLNLKLEKGGCFGFLGLNGAGKTTTLRMIAGLAKPTGGEIRVCGELVCGAGVRFGSGTAMKHVGYLPDVPEFYGFMRPREYLALCGRISGMDSASIAKRSDELLKLVGLEGVSRTIGGFSRGMKQRLGIAQALLHNPELLLLDEPTSALDPAGRRELLEIIESLGEHITVLFSTHILSDVERVCDHVGILHGGRLALEGNIEVIRQKYAGRCVHIETPNPARLPEICERLGKLPYIKEAKPDELTAASITVICNDTDALEREICPLFASLNLPLSRFERAELRLEDVFMEVVKA